MKSALKTASTALKRWLALYRRRSIEINLSGAIDTLPLVRDPLTRERMQLAIREMSLALCKARAEYTALLPAGQRIVWDIA